MARPEEMWQCQTVNCGYVYDPDRGDRKGKIPKGTRFEDLPEEWRCPVCGATRKCFRPLAGPGSTAAMSAACETPVMPQAAEAAPTTPQAAKTASTMEDNMDKYVCNVCGYVYDPAQGDPDNGVKAGTAFADLPEDWVCPVCGAPKSEFSKEE